MSSQNLWLPGGLTYTKTVGYCSAACTSNFPSGGIKIIGNVLHGHVYAKALRLRHVRNGVELPTIDTNWAYDQNFQQMSVMVDEVTVLPGDDLIVECWFNTENIPTNEMIYAGVSTLDEMCLTLITVYPFGNLITCLSSPTG